jgi:hypothetical protein
MSNRAPMPDIASATRRKNVAAARAAGSRIRRSAASMAKPERTVTATCHCGAVRIHASRAPRTLTRCNCSICRRYGALWAYFSASSVRVEAAPGALARYAWKRRTRTYFRCNRCGCVTHYKYRKQGAGYPLAVNASNFEPVVLKGARIRRLDGAATWTWKYERQPYAPPRALAARVARRT